MNRVNTVIMAVLMFFASAASALFLVVAVYAFCSNAPLPVQVTFTVACIVAFICSLGAASEVY